MEIMFLILKLIFVFLTVDLALKKKRSPWVWLALALLFSYFAWVVLYFLPDEEVVKEEVKPKRKPPADDRPLWYYLDQAQKTQGPFSLNQMHLFLQEGKIGGKTFVWEKGMKNWRQVFDFEIFQDSCHD